MLCDVYACQCVGWWYRPEFIIMELNINAAITSPAHDESVPVTQEPYTVRGYAYSGMLPACLQRRLELLHGQHSLNSCRH